MAVSPDAKENYKDLQQTTGETYANMADRLIDPALLNTLDPNGRAAHHELAAFVRTLSDDPDVLARFRGESNTPQGRSATGKQQNG